MVCCGGEGHGDSARDGEAEPAAFTGPVDTHLLTVPSGDFQINAPRTDADVQISGQPTEALDSLILT